MSSFFLTFGEKRSAECCQSAISFFQITDVSELTQVVKHDPKPDCRAEGTAYCGSVVETTRIDSAAAADLRECLSQGEGETSLAVSGFSIGAVVELTCLRFASSNSLRPLLDHWAQSSPILQRAFAVYQHGERPEKGDMWAARGLEFFPIRGGNWADASHYHPFESRFSKAAKEKGFGDKADALAGAMFEMADNVAQHSGSTSSRPFPGLIGYYVTDGHAAFAIGDLGRGVLASLRENPKWVSISDSKAALMAVVEQHASRRIHGGEGEGFKQVFRSLADLNGVVELRSHDGRVRLTQTADGREAQPQFTGFCPGLQLSVNCSLKGPSREEIFPLDNLT